MSNVLEKKKATSHSTKDPRVSPDENNPRCPTIIRVGSIANESGPGVFGGAVIRESLLKPVAKTLGLECCKIAKVAEYADYSVQHGEAYPFS